MTSSVPSTLRKHICIAVSRLHAILNKYGMTVNFEPGKTEAIVVYRGKKALEQKQRLLKPTGSRNLRIPIHPDASQDIHGNNEPILLRVVGGISI